MTAGVPSVDPGRAELRGPLPAMHSLLAGGEPPAAAMTVPLLAAGLRAARAPATRWRVAGLDAEVEAVADEDAALLLADLGEGRGALRGCTPSGLLGLLATAVRLGPRPRRDERLALDLPAAAMARLLSDRAAVAGGLTGADAQRWQPVLDGLERHWRVEVERADAASAPGQATGWYLEVVDARLGLWTVEEVESLVRLAPTDATAVLDELAALPGRLAGSRAASHGGSSGSGAGVPGARRTTEG